MASGRRGGLDLAKASLVWSRLQAAGPVKLWSGVGLQYMIQFNHRPDMVLIPPPHCPRSVASLLEFARGSSAMATVITDREAIMPRPPRL